MLERWQNSGLPLIDVRTEEEFAAGHLRGSTWIGGGQLLSREECIDGGPHLPPSGASLWLLGRSAAQCGEVAAALAFGYTVEERLSTEELPWLFSAAGLAGLLGTGAGDSRVAWLPSPCLPPAVEEMEARLPPERRRAVDLACGLGRDAAYLALRGWGVLAVDHLEKQLGRVPAFAARYGVQGRVGCLLLDLEGAAYPLEQLPADGFDLVNVARYLHRPLFAEIKRILAPGGFVCYHTFMDGCQHTRVARPRRPQFLLQHGELRAVFCPPDYDCLLDQIHVLSDGRPTSLFVARKREQQVLSNPKAV